MSPAGDFSEAITAAPVIPVDTPEMRKEKKKSISLQQTSTEIKRAYIFRQQPYKL